MLEFTHNKQNNGTNLILRVSDDSRKAEIKQYIDDKDFPQLTKDDLIEMFGRMVELVNEQLNKNG